MGKRAMPNAVLSVDRMCKPTSCFLGLFTGRGRPRFLTTCPSVINLCEQIVQIAGFSAGVLIEGESGTGKELVARALHLYSPRRRMPFLAVNCASLRDSILESEIFGHVAGAFTGATAEKAGLVELADKGTFFMDEVSEMSAAMQATLLRFLEERECRRVGATVSRQVDVRIIAASNKNLEKQVREGRFRHDLYCRLKVAFLDIPPLRDRRSDVPLLIEVFQKAMELHYRKAFPRIERPALQILHSYPWPGNVRELKHCLEALYVSDVDGRICAGDVLKYLGKSNTLENVRKPRVLDVDEIRKKQIEDSFQRQAGNKAAMVRELGISRQTLYDCTSGRPIGDGGGIIP